MENIKKKWKQLKLKKISKACGHCHILDGASSKGMRLIVSFFYVMSCAQPCNTAISAAFLHGTDSSQVICIVSVCSPHVHLGFTLIIATYLQSL